MDRTTEKLAHYVTSLRYSDVPTSALHMAKKLLIDAVACAVGGHRAEPSAIARRLAAQTNGAPPARVLGSGALTTGDATFRARDARR